jgi:pimeloyl-ACP methyl ester carboxylesterase
MECELKDITVHYETRGEGRPIVMLHGWSADHRWMAAIDGLLLTVPLIVADDAKRHVPAHVTE